jgi:hypothetical protein
MSKDTGGPAFPSPQNHTSKEGMTLRDYFAAKAMQGLMGRVWGNQSAEELFPIWAKSAYAVADAMLKARKT